jgi:transcriptional regulatory protein RtcR
LSFATSPEALWPGNFRDLHASLVRMATLAPSGRIDLTTAEDEIAHLRELWRASSEPDSLFGLQLDRFEQVQLAEVVAVCRTSRSLSEAGRTLFAVSRAQKGSVNDADRLRKYLARFGLDFEGVRGS